MLVIRNSMTGEKEPLIPITPNLVRMYVCGITVYDFIHIGHARMLIVFDVVQRYLRAAGYHVTYVRNVTDIDDKIIARAAQNGEDWRALAARFTTAMQEDCVKLGVAPPDLEPRATDFIPQIIEMTCTLISKGYAYVAANGDVLYSVRKFTPYGALSGKRLEDLRSGARVALDETKEDPLDFVLWKHAKPGEPSWDSPWGPGRPGWHIECSAMSTALLGQHFEIHGGGMDLKFPHHENEIAQSCAACGSKFVNLWMHNGFVNVNDEKMAKSTGNFFTVRDVLPTLRDPEVLRLLLLGSHYTGPINYSLAQITQAEETLLGLYRALKDAPESLMADVIGDPWARFAAALDDDFNTPEALAVMQQVSRELNRAKNLPGTVRTAGNGNSLTKRATAVAEGRPTALDTFKRMGAMLGILKHEPAEFLKRSVSPIALADADIETLVAARTAARQAKNFAESDRIRNTLTDAGIELEDRPGGVTQWRRQ